MSKPVQRDFGSYITGFGLSIVLTLAAYFVVVDKLLHGAVMLFVLVELALAQLLVQLYFFLHLGRESKPKWNLMVFILAAGVVAILVFGSLWIMDNLNYNLMTPTQTTNYISNEEGIHK